MSLELNIYTPLGNAFNGKVRHIQVPATEGKLGILKNHAPFVTTLEKGILKVETEEGENKEFSTESGVVEVLDNIVTVVTQLRAEK